MTGLEGLEAYGPWGLLLLMFARETIMLGAVRRELVAVVGELRSLVRVMRGDGPGGGQS